MTHDELLWAINSVVESGPCETVGHYSSAKALCAVVEIAKRFQDAKWVNKDFEEGFHVAINIVIQSIEKELQ